MAQGRKALPKGMCQSSEGCTRPATYVKRPLCEMHYRRENRKAIGAYPLPVHHQIPVTVVRQPSDIPVPVRVLPAAPGFWRVEIAQQPDWSAAACKGDPELFEYFFGEVTSGTHGHHMLTSRAQGLCLSCPIRVQCQEWGLAHEEYGMWGGLTTDQRRRVRGARRQQMDHINSVAWYQEKAAGGGDE